MFKYFLNSQNSKFILCLLGILFFSLPGYASAANLPYINKSKIRLSVAPGKQAYGEIILENSSPEPRTMKLYLEDWSYLGGGDGAKEFMPVGTLKRSSAPWINFSPAEFVLPAFAKQRISYSVKVPADASGGYYAALFFQTQMAKLTTAKEVRGAGIDLNVRIATLFFVEVAGTVNRSAIIDNLSLKKESPSGGLRIELDFTNSGNVDITCSGTFHLMDKEGMIYARGEFNNLYTFPKDKAKLIAVWKDSLAAGKYDLVFAFELGKDLLETEAKRVPVITKEVEIGLSPQGQILQVSTLK